MATGRKSGSVIAADFNASGDEATGVVSPRDQASGQASGRIDQYPKASGAITEQTSGQGNGIVSPRDPASGQASGREASSGMATGRRQHEPPIVVEANARSSAHATESLAATDRTGMSGAQSNPMYKESVNAGEMPANRSKVFATDPAGNTGSDASANPMYHDSGNAGTNPLYQSKGKVAAKPATNAPAVQPYKDGEDMTTHYRPGNNKTSKTENKSQSSGTQAH